MRVIDRMTNVVLRRFEATGHPMWRPYHERGMNWVWFDTISAASGRRGAASSVLGTRS